MRLTLNTSLDASYRTQFLTPPTVYTLEEIHTKARYSSYTFSTFTAREPNGHVARAHTDTHTEQERGTAACSFQFVSVGAGTGVAEGAGSRVPL